MNEDMYEYSVYRKGLRISDYVYCKIALESSVMEVSFLVLDRKFLFSKPTRYGHRTFFEYTVYHNNAIEKIKTQQIQVLKTISSK